MHSRVKALYFFIMATLAVLPVVAQAPEESPQFSSDFSLTSANGDVTGAGKMYFDRMKVRMEMSMQGRELDMIADEATNTTYMIMPAQKMYMEMHGQSPAGSRMPDVHQFNPDNPCANQAGVTCKKTGTETVNDRLCDKWVFSSEGGQDRTLWIDQKTHVPIKGTEANGTTFEMKNFKEGAQAASLFEVPQGYRKLDMPAGMPVPPSAR